MLPVIGLNFEHLVAARCRSDAVRDRFMFMFNRYQDYYEIDFERSFSSAAEVDEFLRAHRWPPP